MTAVDSHSDACQQALDLIDRFISDELDGSARAQVSSHVANCVICAHELEQRLLVRRSLRTAALAEPVPAGLADAIRRQRSTAANADALPASQTSNAGNVVALPAAQTSTAGSAVAPPASQTNTDGNVVALPASRTSTARRWLYAAAATMVLALGAWLITRSDQSPPTYAEGPLAPEEQLANILQVGLTDHVECAVKYEYADEEYSHEKILAKLGDDYDGLADLVRSRTPGFRLTLGHHCSFAGHDFIHLILKKDSSVISLAITERYPDETFPASITPTGVYDGIPVFANTLQGYEVAGFESGRYLVFAISDMPRESHMHLASILAKPLSGFLRTVRT